MLKSFSFRRLAIWTLVIAGAVFAFYQLKFRAVPVSIHVVARSDLRAEVMGTGTLDARVKTTVSARIQERLMEVLVDQGDAVKAGQLLARLDDAETAQQVAIAEATLEAAKQTAERVHADLARSEAVLAQARLDHKRLMGLLVSSAVSQTDAEKAAEALQVAEADLKRSHAAIAEAQGQALVAEKTLMHRREQMAFTRISAPYDGLVIRRDRNAGDMLVPGGSLMELISLNEIWVSAWVDETAIPEVAAEQPARVVFRSEPDKSYAGTVSRLGLETDRETREFLVDVRVTELPGNWTIGQRAEVFIETGRESDVPVLPEDFLAWRDDRPGVLIPVNGRATWREVTPGLRGSGKVSIRESLTAGETVIRHRESPRAVLHEGERIALP